MAPAAWVGHTPLDARVLFSSVGSGLGNVGQASYAASNACLDACAISLRVRGMLACSMQWPIVGGAGMGAAASIAMGDKQVSAQLTGVCITVIFAVLSGLVTGAILKRLPGAPRSKFVDRTAWEVAPDFMKDHHA